MKANLPHLLLIFSITTLILCSVSAHEEHPDSDSSDEHLNKCYGLALSDSADLGPYQAGVLVGLIKNLQPEKVAYKAISGVALGAINAYILSTVEIGQET